MWDVSSQGLALAAKSLFLPGAIKHWWCQHLLSWARLRRTISLACVKACATSSKTNTSRASLWATLSNKMAVRLVATISSLRTFWHSWEMRESLGTYLSHLSMNTTARCKRKRKSSRNLASLQIQVSYSACSQKCVKQQSLLNRKP